MPCQKKVRFIKMLLDCLDYDSTINNTLKLTLDEADSGSVELVQISYALIRQIH